MERSGIAMGFTQQVQKPTSSHLCVECSTESAADAFQNALHLPSTYPENGDKFAILHEHLLEIQLIELKFLVPHALARCTERHLIDSLHPARI